MRSAGVGLYLHLVFLLKLWDDPVTGTVSQIFNKSSKQYITSTLTHFEIIILSLVSTHSWWSLPISWEHIDSFTYKLCCIMRQKLHISNTEIHRDDVIYYHRNNHSCTHNTITNLAAVHWHMNISVNPSNQTKSTRQTDYSINWTLLHLWFRLDRTCCSCLGCSQWWWVGCSGCYCCAS